MDVQAGVVVVDRVAVEFFEIVDRVGVFELDGCVDLGFGGEEWWFECEVVVLYCVDFDVVFVGQCFFDLQCGCCMVEVEVFD